MKISSNSIQIFDRIKVTHDGSPRLPTPTSATTTPPPLPTTTELSGKWKDVVYYDDYDYSDANEDYDVADVNWDGPIPYKKPTPWEEVESAAPGQQWDKEVEDLVKGGLAFMSILREMITFY